MKKEFGVILRSYAADFKDVASTASRAVKSIECIRALRSASGEEIFSEIIVLVPSCKDCGSTAAEILKKVNHLGSPSVAVLSVDGDPNSDVLNIGVDLLADLGITYATIISNKAISILSVKNMDAKVKAFNDGAKAVGVVLPELKDVVLQGRLQNTFCSWEIEALQDVGGFDSKIGVEEMTPLVRLIRNYGKCIGVFVPSEVSVFDIGQTDAAISHHEKVVGTKVTRQQEEVQRVNSTFEFIQSGIMSGYPKTI